MATTLDRGQRPEPLSRNSKRSRERYTWASKAWHAVAPDAPSSGAWRLCACSRGAYKTPYPSTFGRKVRKDRKFGLGFKWK